MQKLFIDFEPNGQITLNEEQSRHIAKALRMKKGDMLTLTNGDGNDYGCQINGISGGLVTLSVCYKQANNSEPSVKVTLYQGVPKASKLEDVIQKCTELGIAAICPTLTHRSVSRPDEKQAKKKGERYKKIALEAAQQSGRGIVPEIMNMTELKKAVENDESELKILFYEGGGEPISKIITPGIKSAAIFIGPEGGFEPYEADMARKVGLHVCSMGARILRCETAPVVALTALMYESGNLE